ncbi:hypothetical protein J19TS2_34040 [Cohnella xylanilytica]|nr:hypothetical protein J19TS2_34040 [Cohnella xylanilytica]
MSGRIGIRVNPYGDQISDAKKLTISCGLTIRDPAKIGGSYDPNRIRKTRKHIVE